MTAVTISRQAMESLRRGHPWIFRGSIVRSAGKSRGARTPAIERLERGTIVRILGEDGQIVGAGVHDPESPIAIRVWSIGPDASLDATTFRRRLERAIAIREKLFHDRKTTAYRLLNGEGDRTPGFVIDRYADVAVLRIDGDAARDVAGDLTRDLETVLRKIGVTTLLEREATRDGKQVVVRFGQKRDTIEVEEHGVPFIVDLIAGQKTGAFLDQRENRRRIGELVERRRAAGSSVRVLNLFSYTGGFSLRAALAGGTVTSVDIAARAHATAQASFKLAGVDPSKHSFVSADAFAWLAEAKRKKLTWDVVISDPPSFAPSERAKPKAISAYRAIHRACADVLADGGHFVAASCSSHVTHEDFMGTLDDLSLGRNDLRVLESFGPPPDHATLPSFPEGRYLKLVLLS